MKTYLFLILSVIVLIQSSSAINHENALLKAIRQKIEAQPLGAHDLSFEDMHGNITLTGKVGTAADAELVETRISEVAGVKSVINRLIVADSEISAQPAIRGEQALLKEILKNIGQDPLLQERKIEAQARGSYITLNGMVASTEARERAAEITAAVVGVEKVKNNLRIKVVTDEDLAELVRKSLLNNDNLLLDNVLIKSVNGVVSFSGSVATQREMERILSNSLMVDGVKDVKNNLKVGKSY